MMMQRRNGGDNFWNQGLDRGLLMESPPPSKLLPNDASSPSLMQPSSSTSSGGVGGGLSSVRDGGLGYIEHTVTKFDTLAGVAIKYGVEVADVKRMNGLTTDLQMFSRKTLRIPLPGRHPPSPIMSNGYDIQGKKKSEMTPPRHRNSDLPNSIKSLKLSSSSPQSVSTSIDALRDYYGLKPIHQNGDSEKSASGTDSYKKESAFSSEHGPKPPQSPHTPLGLHRKCKSLANELSEQGVSETDMAVANGKVPDSDTWYDRLMRRRRSEIDLQNHTPETMLKPDNSTNSSSAFSAAAGKGLALRPNAVSRTGTASEADGMPPNMPPLKLGDPAISEVSSGVKKSSSSPSFNDTYNSTSSLWPTTMLNLTADLQASTAAIAKPIFDGLPKPISGRKSKAAID